MKRLHYISGMTIMVFIVLHLLNHAVSILGINSHIVFMEKIRHLYRSPIAEILLLLAVCIQIFSGLKLFIKKRKNAITFFDHLQVWTGLYLSAFFVIHLAAIFGGRLYLHLDTNFYFGVAGLNTFPFNLFFIPYYALAIISVFGHLAAVHSRKMKYDILHLNAEVQSKLILTSGILLTLIIFYGLTNHFRGVVVPQEYKVLIGG